MMAGVGGFPGGTRGEEPACRFRRHRDTGSISASGRSPGGGHSNPLQYSCLESLMDRGALGATVYRIIKSQTRLKWLSMHAPCWGAVGNLQAKLGIHLRAGVWKLELRQHFYVEVWKQSLLFYKPQSFALKTFHKFNSQIHLLNPPFTSK